MTEQHATDVVESDRLALTHPSRADEHELFSILSDPRVWTHFPSLRQTKPAQTLAMIDRWIEGWKVWGLDMWSVRLKGDSVVIGYGGCSMRAEAFWNLGYRLAAEAQGHGYATELAAEALQRANMTDPERPVVAYLLEHNAASERVAVKLGMELVHRAPDAGNPDPSAVRLIYSDRPLSSFQLAATLR